MAQAPGTLPSQEEFKIGGAETVRGYKYGEMHGDRMVYMNSEYRFKIAKSLQAALFVDAGQAWKASAGNPSPLKYGYGAGLRLDTPLGIMRLDSRSVNAGSEEDNGRGAKARGGRK
jgi:outer membrane protein insertion porin family